MQQVNSIWATEQNPSQAVSVTEGYLVKNGTRKADVKIVAKNAEYCRKVALNTYKWADSYEVTDHYTTTAHVAVR